MSYLRHGHLFIDTINNTSKSIQLSVPLFLLITHFSLKTRQIQTCNSLDFTMFSLYIRVYILQHC